MTSRMHALPQLALSALLLVLLVPAVNGQPIVSSRITSGAANLQSLVADATLEVDIAVQCNSATIGSYSFKYNFDDASLLFVSATTVGYAVPPTVGQDPGEVRFSAFDATSTFVNGTLARLRFQVKTGATDNTLTLSQFGNGLVDLDTFQEVDGVTYDNDLYSTEPVACPGDPSGVEHGSLYE